MNDFKKRNKVEGVVPIEEKKTDFLTEEEKEKNEIIALIFSALNKQELTKEEQEKLLATEGEILHSGMLEILLNMAKESIKTGELKQENYEKYVIQVQKKVSLGLAVGEEWERDPKKAEKEESVKDNDAR